MITNRLFFAALVLLISANVHGQDSTKVLSAQDIAQLIPDEVKDYKKIGKPVSKVIKVGGIQYSLCDKRFLNEDQIIKFLLFDFKEAPIMYTQAIKKWSLVTPVDTDSLVQRALVIEGCEGWETYNRSMNSSQIFLGIHKRFFLTIEGERVDLVRLKSLLTEVDLSKYPK
jgi:hypothetical protein